MMTETIKSWRENKPFRYWVLTSAVMSVVINGLFALGNWYAVSTIGYGGSIILMAGTLLAVLLLLAAVAAVPASLISLLFQRWRKPGTIFLTASVVYLLIGFPAMGAGGTIRMTGFKQQTERGMPLIKAIEAFTISNSRPPNTLEELVPDFLSSIPQTGMPAYPQWKYVVGDAAEEWDGNPWVLYMNCYSGGFDKFMYFPKQNYPESGYGGWLERVGDWAYVHE